MTSTTGASVTLPEDRDARVPLPRLIQVEMRKMLDTRAGFWLLVVIALLTLAAMVLVAIFAPDDARTFDGFLQLASTPQGFLLPVLGVLLVTSEWGQRAALTTFTLVPRRTRVLVAKVLAALVIGLVMVLLAVLLAALVTAVRGGPDAWSAGADSVTGAAATPVSEALWRFGLLQSLGILQGLAFGMLFLNSAAAIVTFFILPTLSAVVFNLVPALQDAAPWLDAGSAESAFVGGDPVSGEDWVQLLTSTLLWIALPMAVGAWRILRSEVK